MVIPSLIGNCIPIALTLLVILRRGLVLQTCFHTVPLVDSGPSLYIFLPELYRCILWYIDVYCHNAIRVTPKQTGSAAGSGIRSSCCLNLRRLLKLCLRTGWSPWQLQTFIRIHESSFVSSCFISVHIFSRRVWIKEFWRWFFVFFHPKFKLQEFLARRLFVCSKQQTLRIVVAERLLEGEKTDGIG